MVRQYHWLDGDEFEQTPGDSEGQGSWACCSPWGGRDLDTTEWLNNKTCNGESSPYFKRDVYQILEFKVYMVTVEWQSYFLGGFCSCLLFNLFYFFSFIKSFIFQCIILSPPCLNLFLYILNINQLLRLSNCISSVQSLSHVWLFATPWTSACQASLSIANSQSLIKLLSIELVMPSNHLILYCPLLLLPSIFPRNLYAGQEATVRTGHGTAD